MTDSPVRISQWQMLLLVFALSLGVDPFKLPSLLMQRLGARAAWWGDLPAVVVGLWGIAVAAKLSRRFHGQPVSTTALTTLGPYLGYPYLAALIALCLGRVSSCVLVFAPVAHADLLPRLPLALVSLMIAFVGMYAAYSGVEPIARIAEVLAPLFLVGLAAIYAPLAFLGRFGHLLPLRPPAWSAWLSPVALSAAGTVRGFVPLLILGPLTAEPPTGGRLALATTLAWLLVIASIFLPLALFGARLTPQFRYPFLAAVSALSWHWLPVRNLVSLTLFTWYGIVLLVFSTNLWMATWLLGQLAPALSRTVLTVAFTLAVALAASLPRPEATLRSIFMSWDIGDVVLGVLVPTGIWLLARRTHLPFPSRAETGDKP